jgi:hypothetical protein
VTRRFFAGGFLFAVAVVAACGNGDDSTEKTGSSGVADPADGCILAADASEAAYPLASDLPSGSCDATARACESVVAAPCGTCGMTSPTLGQCACVGGAWSCTLASSNDACPACPADAGTD